MSTAQITMNETPDVAFAPGSPSSYSRVQTRRSAAGSETSGRNGAGKRRAGRKIKGFIFAVFALAGIGAGANAYLQHAGMYEETDNAFVEADVHPISSRVAGDIVEVLVDDNQIVEKGQPLARLDPRDFEMKLQAAKTELQQAEAQITQAESAMAQARAELKQSESQITTNDAQLEKARADFGRAEQLYRGKDKVISRQEYDTAKAAFEAAKGSHSGAGAGREAAAAGLRTAEANRTLAVARKEHAQAAVADAELQLSYTTITAPTAGRIAKKSAQTGQRVQPGQALMAVVEPQTWVVANFKESQLAKMRPGQPVEVEIDAIGGKQFTAHVDSFAPGTGAKFSLLPPDNATGNFTKIVQRVPVKLLFEPDSTQGFESRIAPGLSATVKVRVKEPAQQ